MDRLHDAMHTDAKLTYDDYLRIPEDGKRHEIVDGRHVVNAAPSPRHQRALVQLTVALFRLVESTGRGKVYVSPIDVLLSPFDVLQPDLIVVLGANAGIVGERNAQGPPDLVVEILSPSTRRYDRKTKRARYDATGVAQYWIVDPDARTVEDWRRVDGRLVCVETARERVAMVGVDGALDVAVLWAE